MNDDFAFSIQTGSAEPIYRQLVEHVRRRVASGQIRAGDEITVNYNGSPYGKMPVWFKNV